MIHSIMQLVLIITVISKSHLIFMLFFWKHMYHTSEVRYDYDMLYWSLKPLCCKKNSNLKSWPNRHHKSKVKYEALAIKYWCPHFKNLQKKNCKNHTKDLFEKKMLSRWIETCLMFNFYKRKLLVYVVVVNLIG